ncbi:unnamed protein product [Tetraodon nigroviridis]|uniref:(spotted green pufferfish) hypothetical protein n=1 Tax=Tetraodon nigroviridis TaxID=99883 RepID=Q4RPC5_TETNG|nr:unnamed protein product [Tetraodon nigroviridis]
MDAVTSGLACSPLGHFEYCNYLEGVAWALLPALRILFNLRVEKCNGRFLHNNIHPICPKGCKKREGKKFFLEELQLNVCLLVVFFFFPTIFFILCVQMD